MDVNSPEAEQWSETMRLKSHIRQETKMAEASGNNVVVLSPNPGRTSLEIRPSEKYMEAIAVHAREWGCAASRAAEIMIEQYLDAEEADRHSR